MYVFIQQSCILEFDGASKGNPGLSGAGAVLRAEDRSVVCAVHEKKNCDSFRIYIFL
jgi:ribonuclease HI